MIEHVGCVWQGWVNNFEGVSKVTNYALNADLSDAGMVLIMILLMDNINIISILFYKVPGFDNGLDIF